MEEGDSPKKQQPQPQQPGVSAGATAGGAPQLTMVPEPPVSPRIVDITRPKDAESLRRMVQRLFIVGITQWPEDLAFLEKFQPAMVQLPYLFLSKAPNPPNMASDPSVLKSMCEKIHSLPGAPLVTLNHEPGPFLQSLLPDPAKTSGFTIWPTMHQIEEKASALSSAEAGFLAEKIGRGIGKELRAIGVDLTWGPVVDVARPEYHYNCVGRACSSGEMAKTLGSSFVKGLQSTGVGASPKHFPGMGAATSDSHTEMPTIATPLDTLKEVDLPPFKSAFEAGAFCVMTNHAAYSALPSFTPDGLPLSATHSSSALVDLLRNPDVLGFDGVCVSDDMGMEGALVSFGGDFPKAVVGAIAAGCDLVLVNYYATERATAAARAIITAVEKGELPFQRIYEAHKRVERLSRRIRQMQKDCTMDTSLSCVGSSFHQRIAKDVAGDVLPISSEKRKPVLPEIPRGKGDCCVS